MTERDADQRPTAAERAGWDATLEELAALADQRRDAGWSVVTVAPVETEPEPPDDETDQFGLVYTVTDETADELRALLEGGTIDAFETFRRTVGGACYLVTELRDTDRQRCVLLAGAYDAEAAEPLATHAAAVGHVFTRLHDPDGDLVAEIRHETYEKLFPRSFFE